MTFQNLLPDAPIRDEAGGVLHRKSVAAARLVSRAAPACQAPSNLISIFLYTNDMHRQTDGQTHTLPAPHKPYIFPLPDECNTDARMLPHARAHADADAVVIKKKRLIISPWGSASIMPQGMGFSLFVFQLGCCT